MEVEESFDELFKDWDFENSDWVLKLAKKCIATSPGEIEVLRALEIILCFCFKKYSVEDLEEEVFQIACPAAQNIIVEKFNYLKNNPTSCVESLNFLLQIISYFDRVFVYFNEIPKIPIIEVKSFITVISEILLTCFTHCSNSGEVYGSLFDSLTECLSNFFKTCCNLQDQFLCFIVEKIECDAEDDREVLLLDEVMTVLSKIGIILINLEVKTMAKVWKSFALLIEKHLSCLKHNFNIGETIKDLSNSIIFNMESSNQELSKVIKLNCFLLKLVIKFSEVFIECLQNCQNSLLKLLLMLCKYDVGLVEDVKFKSNEDLLKQLTVGRNPLLTQIMTDVGFIKECEGVGEEVKKSVEFCVFCCLVMNKLKDSNADTRSLWFNKKENVLQWIFICASSSEFITHSDIRLPNIVVNGKEKKFLDLYEYVFTTTCAFLMTATCEEYCLIENILIQNVMQMNPIRAVLAIDIWCLLARFADSDLCFSQIQILGKVFQEFHPQTVRVEKCYLASLIRRLFPLLSGNHRSAFLRCFKPSFYSSVWDGMCTSGLSQKEAVEIRQFVFADVKPLVDEDNVDTICDLGILRNQEVNGNFENKISKLWKFNCEVLSSTTRSLEFLKVVCCLTAGIVGEMSSENLLLVLTQIKKLLSIGQPTCVKLFFIWILNSLSTVRIPNSNIQKKIITNIAEIFRNLLSSKEILVKTSAFECFYFFSHVTTHEEIIPTTVQNAPELKIEITNYFKKKFPELEGFHLDGYMRELYRLSFQHVCPVREVMPKKVKFDSVNIENTFIRWREDGKVILEHFQSLSESEKREIKKICNSMLSLLE